MSQGAAHVAARLLTLNTYIFFEIPSLLWWLFIFGTMCLLAPFGANTLCPASYQTFRYFADANHITHGMSHVTERSAASAL